MIDIIQTSSGQSHENYIKMRGMR